MTRRMTAVAATPTGAQDLLCEAGPDGYCVLFDEPYIYLYGRTGRSWQSGDDGAYWIYRRFGSAQRTYE